MLHTARRFVGFRAAAAFVAAGAMAGCGLLGPAPEAHPFSPGVWSSADGEIVVEIKADGTGSYTDLPRWEGDAFGCILEEAEPQTGDFTWVYSEELDKVLFGSDAIEWYYEFEAGGPRGTDWNKLLFFVCMPDLPGWIVLDRTE